MLEVKLTDPILQQLISSLGKVQPDIILYEDEFKRRIKYIKDKFGSTNPVAAEEIQALEEKLSRLNVSDKVGDKLLKKLNSPVRPIKLQKNERFLIARAIRNLDVDYSVITKYSSITKTTDPNKFYGYPRLKKAADNRIREVKENLNKLTRSDIDVVIV